MKQRQAIVPYFTPYLSHSLSHQSNVRLFKVLSSMRGSQVVEKSPIIYADESIAGSSRIALTKFLLERVYYRKEELSLSSEIRCFTQISFSACERFFCLLNSKLSSLNICPVLGTKLAIISTTLSARVVHQHLSFPLLLILGLPVCNMSV